MENQFQDIEWIERYLDRSMTSQERKQMEQRFEDDPQFKSKYERHKQLINGIRYSHLRSKLDQLRILEKSLPPIEAPAKSFMLAKYFAPLAAAAGLAVIIASYVLINQSPKPEKLYAQYFKPYPNVFEPTVRSNTPLPEDSRALAFAAYDRSDYETAARIFRELLKEKEEPTVLLLLGNANLVLGNVDEAQNNFLTLIKNFDDLDGQAKLYLGLSYLKQGEGEKAKLILQELEEPATYSKKAKELLYNLK
jgi:TolA-binding protein